MPMAEENRVSGTALLQARSHPLNFDCESGVSETLLEFPIVPCRPHGDHTIWLERVARGGNTPVAVQSGIVRLGERCRAIVDVEQHGVEAVSARAEHVSDVTHFDPHASVFQGMRCEWAEGSSVPFHHGGHEFCENDAGVWWQEIERGAEREAHAETPDEHAWPREGSCPAARERGHRFFGAMHTARHEALAIGENDVLARVTGQRQGCAIGRGRLADRLPGFHEAGGAEGRAISLGPKTQSLEPRANATARRRSSGRRGTIRRSFSGLPRS